MPDFIIKQYTENLRNEWETVVSDAKHDFFQVSRSFMDHHKNRFEEMSFIAFDQKGPIGIFPAAKTAHATIVSHPGLTFGGFSFAKKVRTPDAIQIMKQVILEYEILGINNFTIRLLPDIFYKYPSGEGVFGFWDIGFRCSRVDLSSAISINGALPFNSSKKAGIKKSRKAGIQVKRVECSRIHSLIKTVLKNRHDAEIVHSIDELDYLERTFADRVFGMAAFLDEDLLAGIIVFCYGKIWHTQYMAASEDGFRLSALDLIVEKLIEKANGAAIDAISFGISMESGKNQLNEGLLWQKESFGARAIVHQHLRYSKK